jgi:hypothetical protein
MMPRAPERPRIRMIKDEETGATSRQNTSLFIVDYPGD